MSGEIEHSLYDLGVMQIGANSRLGYEWIYECESIDGGDDDDDDITNKVWNKIIQKRKKLNPDLNKAQEMMLNIKDSCKTLNMDNILFEEMLMYTMILTWSVLEVCSFDFHCFADHGIKTASQ